MRHAPLTSVGGDVGDVFWLAFNNFMLTNASPSGAAERGVWSARAARGGGWPGGRGRGRDLENRLR